MDFLLFFSSLLSYLILYKYVALFILVFLGAVGFPIPSGTLLMAVGAFASQSYFDLPISLAVAIFANILGDLFDYFLLRKFGQSILKKNYHKRFSFIVKLEKYVKSLENYIAKRQGLTILFSRFFGSASTIINFLSGLIPVPLKTFIFYDALGNFLSITLMMLLGFFISASWQQLAGIIGTASAIISGLILLTLAITIFLKTKKARK